MKNVTEGKLLESTMINGENFGWERSDDKVLVKAEISALSRKCLFHYTSFETLKKIFKNKEILFNQINRVNDGKEAKLFNNKEVSKLVFVSCFTHLKIESIPMWYIYGKNNKQHNGSNDAVRIEFKFKTSDIISSFIDECRLSKNSADKNIIWWKSIRTGIYKKNEWYYHVKMSDVVYRIQEIEKHPIKNDEIYSLSAMGRIKRREWQYEKETRLILIMRTFNNLDAPNIDYFLIPIKFCNLKTVTITFNPWMESSLKEEIKNFFKTINELHRFGVQIKFQDSVLTGELSQ